AAGDSWSCALTSTGAVYCWGNRYVTGMNTGTPVLIAGVSNVTQISGHGSFICALSSGNVFCWGANGAGQVGNHSTDGTRTPTMVLAGVSQLGVGHDHACAIKTDGTVWCWGANYQGQVGDGSYGDAHVPKQVAISGMATSISAGSSHSCAVTTTGTYCWGGDIFGELGIGVSDWLTPRAVNLPCD
ncbi:MAG TPA: hypothetical protein VGC41_11160, partial [Kofleriaceae bacterium]